MSSLLRRRFDPSKCKNLLQLASQRLKVLRNKQALAVKKARGDVAKMLEKNQDSNAKLQVEAVFREQKILVLYDSVDQFCHQIINGLESIKSQKECPSDLREAVASLIFAARNCSDLEELKQVSKQFKSKYGSDFYRAAKTLRPDSGVNRQVIQSFSSFALSYDEKLMLLKEIAVENNISWDHETAIPDASKEATNLIEGPNHFASAAKLSQVDTHPITEKQKSRSTVLQNAIVSQSMSAANPLGLPLHAAHQFAKNVGAMGSSMVADRVLQTSVLDPYALARAEGRMDYKAVSNYMKRAHSTELEQENRGNISYERTATQLPGREQGHNGVLDASHSEDVLRRSEGRMPRRRHDLMISHMRNEEEELLELQNAAEDAFVAASHAAEAARAAVNLVRMESLERSRSRQARDENYRKSRMGSKQSFDGAGLFHEDKVEIEHSQQNWMVGNEGSAPYTRDASEDSLKYVVFEQASSSQKYAPSSVWAEGYDKKSESHVPPEVWSEPTLYYPDRIIFDEEHEEPISKEVTTEALSENFHRVSMEEQELDKNVSFSNNAENHHIESLQDKHVRNDLPVLQFDDYNSDGEESVQESVSVPQVEDHIHEEATEEEEPFYLRGRAALAAEDHANLTAKAPFSKANMLMATVSISSTDEQVEKLYTNTPSSEHNSSRQSGLSVEPLGVSNEKEQGIDMGASAAHSDVDEGLQESSSDDYEERESLPAQSSKAPFRHQINTQFSGESSVMNPVAYQESENMNSKESSVKPLTPRKLNWAALIPEEWDLDSSYHKPVPPLGSVKLSSPNESRDPSSQVNRKLTWSSGASVDSESMSERSFDSHKREELGIDSSRLPLNTEDWTKTRDATRVPQPSTARPFAGVSKRSVRTIRSRQNQDARSVSSGNEDMISP